MPRVAIEQTAESLLLHSMFCEEELRNVRFNPFRRFHQVSLMAAQISTSQESQESQESDAWTHRSTTQSKDWREKPLQKKQPNVGGRLT